jgi:DNA-binding CsgD family transcriptional regulator
VSVRGATKSLTERGISKRLRPRPKHRRSPCEYVLSLWLVDGKRPGGHLAFDRFQRDFSDRDLHVLELLRPHLVQLLRNAQTRRDPPDNLTARETEILRLVADGKTNREIAAALYISPGTVRKHLDNITTR